MRSRRLLLMPLFVAMGIAPAVAQSPQTIAPSQLPNVFATQPLPRVPALDLGMPIQGIAPGAREERAYKLNSPQLLKRFDLFGSGPFSFNPPATLIAGLEDLPPGDPVQAALLNLEQRAKAVAMANLAAQRGLSRDERCYAIRDYNFSRVTPGSDATKLSGTSTCEPATQVQLKGATAQPR
jgi:hypothetical protein